MKIRLLTALCLTLAGATARGEVEWLAKVYDFGVFKEADGKVTGEVSFVNHGPEATFISRVRPSCGCTGVRYNDEMVQPGDTATISFTYNPQGRPGHFDKTVKVYLGKENDLTVVRIKGTVIGTESTLLNYYPEECGALRLDNDVLPVGDIKKGRSRHLFMNVYNQGDNVLSPEWTVGSSAVEVEMNPHEIKPGETATFTIVVKADGELSGGPFEIPVKIFPEGKGGKSIEVKVSGVVVPDASSMTLQQLETAPQAFLLPEFVDLGELNGKSEAPFEFTVANEGKDALSVEKVYSRSAALAITRSPSKIKGEEKGIVKGVVRLSELSEGPFRLKVEVQTNDPLHPLRTCDIVGIKKN